MINIKDLFKDETTKKVIMFFHENPNSIDTAKGISIWIACGVNEVEGSLKLLVEKDVLINHKSICTDAFSYTNNRKTIKEIEKYIKKMKDKGVM